MSTWFERSQIPPASTVPEAAASLERIVRESGLNHFAYLMVSPPRHCRVDVYSTAMTNYPLEWVERYIEQNYALVDPVIERAALEFRPFSWTTRLRCSNRLQRQFLSDSRDFGVAEGVTVPVRSPSGALGVFVGAGLDAECVMEASRHGGERLLAIAYGAHEFALGRLRGNQAGGIDGIRLSKREKECLQWTLEGKTAEDVAAILGLSVFTVNRHVFNATHKMGSLNKHHAAVQAFRANLI